MHVKQAQWYSVQMIYPNGPSARHVRLGLSIELSGLLGWRIALHPPLLQARLVECCFTSTETVGLLGTGAQDGHLDFHTTPEL